MNDLPTIKSGVILFIVNVSFNSSGMLTLLYINVCTLSISTFNVLSRSFTILRFKITTIKYVYFSENPL